MDKHTGGVLTSTTVWCQQTTTMHNHNQRKRKTETTPIPSEKRTVKDKFVNENYTLSQNVIYIVFEFRRNTTFDKNLDELALDKLGINRSY